MQFDESQLAAHFADSADDGMFAARRSAFDFRYIVAAIRSNLVLIGAIIGATLAVALIVTLLQTPRYTAATKIQINDTSTRVLASKDVDLGDDGAPSAMDIDRFLKTQIDVLQSRGLALRVAQTMKLASSKRFFAAQEDELPDPKAPPVAVHEKIIKLLGSHLKVVLPRDSRVVTITYESTDPALSADIVNTYAAEFIQSNLQRKFDSSSYARDFVSNQLSEVKRKLQESEKALNDYSRQAGLIRTQNAAGVNGGGDDRTATQGNSVTTTSLLQLNQAANDATAKRIAAEGQWKAINAGSLLAATAVVGNSTISNLLSQKAGVEAELQQERVRHLDHYPTVKAKEQQLAALNRQLQSVATNIRNAVKADYLATVATEHQLLAEVERLKGATLSEQDSNVQYGLLAREVDTNRQVYDGLLQRYKQLNSAAGISLSNISIIDVAEQPQRPSSPDLVKNLVLALLVGIGLAGLTVFIKDQFDDSIRVPEDVESKLGLSLLGVVPRSHEGEPEEALSDPKSPISEAYNSLRGALLYSTTEGLPQVILVTSAQASEGKTTSAFAIASGFARMGKKVVLFDAAGRHRLGQHARRDLPGDPPLVLAPPAFALLATVADDGIPVPISLLLIVGGDLEGERFALLEHRSAIQADAGHAADGELDHQHLALLAGRVIARRPVHGTHRREDIIRLQRYTTRRTLQFVCENIEQNLRIALSVGVPVICLEQLRTQRMRVGQVPVVHHHDTEWGIDVKRLRFFFAVRIARCGVTHLAQPYIARQRPHIAGAKHITHHPFGLVHEKLAALLGNDTCGILATMLQQQQRVINQLIDWRSTDNTNDSTHSLFPSNCSNFCTKPISQATARGSRLFP